MFGDEERLSRIRELATFYEWDILAHQADIKMISFSRHGVRINVYYTTMTVATAMTHPKKGRTQLYRRYVTMQTMRDIFRYPRVHTNEGYYKRKRNAESR